MFRVRIMHLTANISISIWQYIGCQYRIFIKSENIYTSSTIPRIPVVDIIKVIYIFLSFNHAKIFYNLK